MENHAVQIKMVPIGEIKPNPKNRNNHSKEQIDRLCEIIKFQGFDKPLLISNRTGLLVAGHGRLLAAKQLGIKELPAVYRDYVSEEQEYASGISDNSIGSWAELDLAQINLDLPDLQPFDIDLLGIKDFVVDISEKFANKDADSVPENVLDIVKSGELWQLGEHRLLCGDCTVKENVERLMNGEKADMVFTDPPYGIAYEQEHRKSAPKQTKTDVANYFPIITGDKQEYNPFPIFTMFQDVTIFLWGALNYHKHIPGGGSWVVWNKKTEAQANCPFGDFDVCWTNKKNGWKLVQIMWGGFHSTEKSEKKRFHPTQKPVALAEWFFERWGKDAKIIWDGYLGSGSTLIACEKTNRKCYGLEIDEKYCSVIVKRWEDFTGKKAVKLS